MPGKKDDRSGKLSEYRKKRDFNSTPEPEGLKKKGPGGGRIFVIHKHDASRLHYDLRLELDGVLLSWAVPKGPSLNPSDKRLAVHVEDHPLEYNTFEGVIPPGQYGSGTVMVWDRGEWIPEGDPRRDYENGSLKFELKGEKLSGSWALFRFGRQDKDRDNWLLIKHRDKAARNSRGKDVVDTAPLSVDSGRSMEEIASGRGRERVGQKSSSSRKRGMWPDPTRLEGAVKSEMPESFRPQLARLVDKAPDGKDWLHEIKLDGYRLLAYVRKDSVRLVTRNGKDWSDRFPEIAGNIEKMSLPPLLLDGEVVVLRRDGTSSFQALQNALKGGSGKPLYYVFDIPYCGGYDLTGVRLDARKGFLRRLLQDSGNNDRLRFSDHQTGKGERLREMACQENLEGIISKRSDSPYQQERSPDWLKVKCLRRQEFIVGGYTEPGGSRIGFGALVIGYHDEQGRLRYCGRVGTGFKERALQDLSDQLSGLERQTPPFTNSPSGRQAKGVHWVTPQLVIEIEFTEWTDEGRLRHPVFQGLREDKDPEDVHREEPERADSKVINQRTSSYSERIAGIVLSNPDRVLYPEQEISKRKLAEYYVEISEYILPHLADRPLMVTRCPRGRQKDCFYQKHVNESLPDSVKSVVIPEKEEERLYITINSLAGIISLVQSGALEFHPWNCRTDKVEKPDRMIFDLDPGEGVGWDRIIGAARDLRSLLEKELDLRCFVRTSGGKGLHVVVPLRRTSSWKELKEFSRQVAIVLVDRFPERYVATMNKDKRRGRIFIDFFRNGRGATAICNYSTRARPGAPIATPLRWDELSGLQKANAYTVENVFRRLRALGKEPWEDFFTVRQSLSRNRTETLKRLVAG